MPPLGSVFRFEGRVELSGIPQNGTVDLRFTPFAAPSGGGPLAAPQIVSAVVLANRAYAVPIDFGSTLFGGDQRWLQVEVRHPSGAGAFTVLAAREPVLPTPYAFLAVDLLLPFAGTVASDQP